MLHASEQERPDVQVKREQWRGFAAQTQTKNQVFWDESGVNVIMSSNRKIRCSALIGKFFQRGCVDILIDRPVQTAPEVQRNALTGARTLDRVMVKARDRC
jgi:hypothetical protein